MGTEGETSFEGGATPPAAPASDSAAAAAAVVLFFLPPPLFFLLKPFAGGGGFAKAPAPPPPFAAAVGAVACEPAPLARDCFSTAPTSVAALSLTATPALDDDGGTLSRPRFRVADAAALAAPDLAATPGLAAAFRLLDAMLQRETAAAARRSRRPGADAAGVLSPRLVAANRRSTQ